MKKVLLIGSGGAGKSTLAVRVAERTGLPLIALDALFWRPAWCETPRASWHQVVEELVQHTSWVMDGNYGGTIDMRLAACDTVIFLDLPPMLCVWRVLKRRVQFHRRSRPNMAPGCNEHLSMNFILWVLCYRKRHRPGILQKLALVAAQGKQVFILRSPAAVSDFIGQLPMSPDHP